MGFYLKDNLSDPRLIDLYWEEELFQTVSKKFFLKELNALPRSLAREEFFQIFFELELKLAKRAVVQLLARKGYLSQELQKKLSAKGISGRAILQAIACGQKGGYIDDQQEINRQIRSEIRKGRGPQAILMKLKQKRVPEEQLTKVKEQLRRDEVDSLRSWIAKKGIEINQEDFKKKQKLYAQLMRRGFSSEAISSLLKNDWN